MTSVDGQAVIWIVFDGSDMSALYSTEDSAQAAANRLRADDAAIPVRIESWRVQP